jgi:hypothetical protein
MGKWKDGRIDALKDGWTEGWVIRRMDGRKNGWTEGRVN